MKKMILMVLASISVMFIVTGCSPSLDGSSKEAFNKSGEKIMKSLSEKEQLGFQLAMTAVITERTKKFTEEYKKENKGETAGLGMIKAIPKIQKKALESMDGMTYEDIINEFKKISE